MAELGRAPRRIGSSWLLALLFALFAPSASAFAQAKGDGPAPKIIGLYPDATLTVGAGIGLGRVLDTNVMARLRLGALFAYEPVTFNLGVTGELGALAERGFGVELEVNHMSGPWLQLNVSRVERDRVMGHLSLGYFVLGLEWQHAFGERSGNALIFVLRLPIGLLWFMPTHAAQEPEPEPDPIPTAPPR